MVVLSTELLFRIPTAHSLKNKRQVWRSLIDRTKRKLNVAVAEVDTQDAYQMLTVGPAVVSEAGHYTHEMLEAAIRYIEDNAEAELVDVI